MVTTEPQQSRIKADSACVLTLSGHDPSGGAGIQADIEAIRALGAQPCSVITALTLQDSRNVVKLMPQPAAAIAEQAELLFDDLPIRVIKIGLIGDDEIAKTIARLLRAHPSIPVVLDPVLAAGGGKQCAGVSLINTSRSELIPLTTVLTPNSPEARTLAADNDLEQCAETLLALGCRYLLITGTHEESSSVVNRLYHQQRCIQRTSWQRLPYSYHGSGCTLASAIAALIARGWKIESAIEKAQQFSWQSLKHGHQPGRGQHLPNRFFWRENDDPLSFS